jgi:hypothetical protein
VEINFRDAFADVPLLTKHAFTLMDTLTDKTAEFGASENPHTVRG